MAPAYATFANGGHRIQPYFIEQVYNYDNKLLFQANPKQACAVCFNEQVDELNKKLLEAHSKPVEGDAKSEGKDKQDKLSNVDKAKKEDKDKAEYLKALTLSTYNASPIADRLQAPVVQYVRANQAPRILKPRVAYEMADILRDVVQHGTATKARALGRGDIGGKTGTTNEAKDAWFAGFHPTSATVVWMGFDQPETLGRREYGGVAALPVWVDFMRAQLKGVPHQWVSVNNRSKSKKQKNRIIEMTDDGIVTSEEDTDMETGESVKPVTPKKQQRKQPEPEPMLGDNLGGIDNKRLSSPTNSKDSINQGQTPLKATPTNRMPALPE